MEQGNEGKENADIVLDFIYGLEADKYGIFVAEIINDIQKKSISQPQSINEVFIMVNTRVVVSRGQGHNHGATFSTIEANSNDERWAEAARKKSESRKEHTNQPSTEEVRGNSKMRSRRKITKKKVAGSASNGDGEELTHKTYANKIEEEISASNCFKCGKKRHWKRECPKNQTMSLTMARNQTVSLKETCQ